MNEKDKVHLYEQLVIYFDESELQDLCFRMNIDYETLSGQNKLDKSRSLIGHLERRNRLYDLLDICQKLRPNMPWSVGSEKIDAHIITSQIGLTPSGLLMEAYTNKNNEVVRDVTACPLKWNASFVFDLTNQNQFDIKIDCFQVTVVEFLEVSIIGIDQFHGGGGIIAHGYRCEIEPIIGEYKGALLTQEFDYIRLKYGELEAFRIFVMANSQGIYHLTIGVWYILGSKKIYQTLSNRVYQIGFFDSTQHEIRNYPGLKL